MNTIQTYKKIKFSYGIACCRINSAGVFEMLLICKRFTYAFHSFVQGAYNANKQDEMLALFNGMTNDEKFDILSLKFLQLWYRVWLDNVHQSAAFYNAKNKFERTFLADGGIKLRKLIQESKQSTRVWEIPKGRKKMKSETDIHCAVREFTEETGLHKDQYTLLAGFSIVDTYIDDGIKYVNTYYAAIVPRNVTINPAISFERPGQICEVLDVRWLSLNHIRLMDTSKRAAKIARKVFKYAKKQL